MLHPALRRSVQWSIRLVVLAGLTVPGRWLGWKWAGDIILAVLIGGTLELGGRLTLRALLTPRDRRRGLAVREWRAIRVLGNCAEHSDQNNFDAFSLSRTRRTDDAVLIGYATILVRLLIIARVGPAPTNRQLSRLAAECIGRWQAVVRQVPGRLELLFREARDYERDGFPHADWDNFRAMAAAAGALRTGRIRAGRMRFAVAAEYTAYVGRSARDEPSTR